VFADIGRAFDNWMAKAADYGNVTPLRTGTRAAAPRSFEHLDRTDPEAWA
jgi:hypothetical protein